MYRKGLLIILAAGLDETTWVPLIIRNKKLFPRPRAIEAQTSHADLAPTLLGLAGI